MTPRSRMLLALAATLAMAGCGKLGTLERPGPLIGSGAAGTEAGSATSQSMKTIDPRERMPEAEPAPLPAPAAPQ